MRLRNKLNTPQDYTEYYRGFRIGATIIDKSIIEIVEIEKIIDGEETSELYYEGVYESFVLPILNSSGEKLDHLGEIRKMIRSKIK